MIIFRANLSNLLQNSVPMSLIPLPPSNHPLRVFPLIFMSVFIWPWSFPSRHDSLIGGCTLKCSHMIDEKMTKVLRRKFYKGISRWTPTLSIATRIGGVHFFKYGWSKEKSHLLHTFGGTLEQCGLSEGAIFYCVPFFFQNKCTLNSYTLINCHSFLSNYECVFLRPYLGP